MADSALQMRSSALVVVVALAIATGCGEDEPQTPTSAGTQIPANLLTQQDIRQFPAGTPQRATIEWFQAAQFGDVQSLTRMTTPSALRGLSENHLRAVLRLVGPPLARPKIERVTRAGRSASVRLLLLSYRRNSRKVAIAQPTSLPLVRADGRWRVDDVSLLTAAAAAISARQRKAHRTGRGH